MKLSDRPDGNPVPGLDGPIVKQIVAELGPAGERVLRSLRTANSLLESSATENDGLRYAESAAYNIREALDSVAKNGRAGEGGLTAALEAWTQYKLTCGLPGADEPTQREALTTVLDDLARNRQRQAYMTRRLLDWFQRQTGVAPIPGAQDPTVQYQRLRDNASTMLHTDASSAEVRALYNDVVTWFARFFAPPSNIANHIEQLAALPFTAERLADLMALAMNAHHVRLFLERIEDPNWLEPMRQADLIGLPSASEPWPVAALAGESGRLPDEALAELLLSLVDDLGPVPVSDRPAIAFEIARVALWVGPAAHPAVIELLRRFPADDWIQLIAMSVARKLDPADPIQVVVADAVIGNEPRRSRGHRSQELVTRLIDGLTEENVKERFGLIAVKLRRLVDGEPYLALGIVSLSADGVDKSEHVLGISQRMAAAFPTYRRLGLPNSLMLDLISGISGEVGARLTCQVLAGADDIDRGTKLAHLARRITAPTATGDDRALLEDLGQLDDDETELLREAFGPPPPAPQDLREDDLERARGWRWSMILSPEVLIGWKDAIAVATAVHGPPDTSALDRRTPMSGSYSGSSPIHADQLAALDPIEAGRHIAEWRPSESDPWGVSARELARTLESLVKDAPGAWTDDPLEIVRVLREPVYIDHYFRALKARADAIDECVPALMRSIELVQRERWGPTVLGDDDFDYEDDWTDVDSAVVELVKALADANADLTSELDLCWQLAIELAEDLPQDRGSPDQYLDADQHNDPLHGAINSGHGQGLQAVLALGGWEHRNLGAASDRLASALSNAVAIGGVVGLQLRAVVAAARPFAETIAAGWFNDNQEILFGDDLGQVTFDQTLKYSRPTEDFYAHSFERLLSAASRGADNAVAWLLIAHMWDEPEYSFERIVDGLSGSEAALAELCRECARLTAGVPLEQTEVIDHGLKFCELLLVEAGGRIPVASMAGLGGLALANNVSPEIWLDMMEQTVSVTSGVVTHATEVADRCRDLQPSSKGLRIISMLLGHGERWEQNHVESVGVEALQAATNAGLTDDAFNRLRERLIQRGQHAAGSIEPNQEAPEGLSR